MESLEAEGRTACPAEARPSGGAASIASADRRARSPSFLRERDRVSPSVSRLRPLLAGLVAAPVLLLGVPAFAAGPKETQARKALKQALEEDYLNTRFDEAEQKLRAAIQGCTSGCPADLRAKLHAALGAVLAGGKKEFDDARDEFVEALKLDPKIEPDPDVTSESVTFAYQQARKQLKLSSGAPAESKSAKEPPKSDKPEKSKPEKGDADKGDTIAKGDKPDKDQDAPKEPEKPKEPAKKNWVTIAFSPDVSLVAGTNVCSKDSRQNDHYVCIHQDPDGTPYTGTPTKDNADNINAGLALATLRVTLGYDRLLANNVTLGARVGFAFNGASGGGSSFLPLHLEGRLGLWPGHEPFVGSGVRPYFTISGGLAQVDTKVDVQVLEDGVKCGAKNPSSTNSPCTLPVGMPEKRQQTLTVYRQAGLGFASGGFGVQFAPTAKVALFLAVRASVTFPVVSAVFSPEGGLSLGF
jgi:tetratricopeptide (TPR) repeat protein